MQKKKKCAGQYTADLINNNIRGNVQEDVQTGFIINNLLIISDY